MKILYYQIFTNHKHACSIFSRSETLFSDKTCQKRHIFQNTASFQYAKAKNMSYDCFA